VFAAIILLAILIMLFGGLPTLFKGYDRYTIWFESAAGVNPGTPVRRSGVRIGQVESVELNNETGKVRVIIAVEKKYHLYEDDQPVLVRGAIGSDVSIDFVQRKPEPNPAEAEPRQGERQPGKIKQVGFELAQVQPGQGNPPPRRRVPAGAEFEGVSPSDVNTALGQLSRLAPPAERAFNEMTTTLNRYQRMAPLVEDALREFQSLARTTNAVVPELRRTNQEVQELARSARATMPQVQELVKGLNEEVPRLKATNQEILVAARTWGRAGEYFNLFLQTNNDKLDEILKRLGRTLNEISDLLNDTNRKRFADILEKTDQAAQRWPGITDKADALLTKSSGTIDSLGKLITTSSGTIESLGKSVTKANDVWDNMLATTRPWAARSDKITQQLDEGSAKLNKTLTQLQEMMRIIDQEDGTLRRLLADPSLYNNLNESACMLARLMPRLDRVLKDIEVFADKIARHPESLGVSGAIRPSSGLKEAPSNGTEWHTPGH
jgi:ABC-type transporter Mla subunit MlaD